MPDLDQQAPTYCEEVTNVLYVDNKRTDSYIPNGSFGRPFKKIQDAIDAVTAPSYTNKWAIVVAPGPYYSDALTINKGHITFRGYGINNTRITGKITVATPDTNQTTFEHLRISGGLDCFCNHIAINVVDCYVSGTDWVMNPTIPADDEYLQVWGGLFYANAILTNVYAYLMGGGYYSNFTATNKEFNINNADINTPFQVTLNGTVIASAYGNRAGSSAFIVNNGATLYMDADTEGGSIVTVNVGGTLTRTTKASNISNDSLVPGTTVKDALDTLAPIVPPVEILGIYPRPEGTFLAGQALRAAQLNTFEGGAFRLFRKSIMNRLIFRLTGGGPVTLDFALYQTANGGAGVANKVATITGFVAAAAPANYEVPFTEGDVTFEEGSVFLIWCKTAGAGTVRVYGIQTYDLLNTNVQPNTHPLVFTTTLAPPAPATINPINAAVIIPSSGTDLLPVIRLKKV